MFHNKADYSFTNIYPLCHVIYQGQMNLRGLETLDTIDNIHHKIISRQRYDITFPSIPQLFIILPLPSLSGMVCSTPIWYLESSDHYLDSSRTLLSHLVQQCIWVKHISWLCTVQYYVYCSTFQCMFSCHIIQTCWYFIRAVCSFVRRLCHSYCRKCIHCMAVL